MIKVKVSFSGLILILLLNLFANAQTTASLPRSVPEAEGVSSKGIIDFIDAIGKSKEEWHSFMLLRHGKVVAEGWWDPYQSALRHSMYSVSKSFTSTAIGFAVQEKKLSVKDTVVSFFSKELPDTVSKYLSQLTVKDLLIMSSGHDPEPTGAVIHGSKSWVAGFLGIPLIYQPGTKFLYNTMATYMLSAIVQKVTGEKVMDYLTTKLFDPLGIKGIDWEISPQNINAGGYGLRLKTEDMARFGQFYLQKGSWNGKQLLSPQWTEEATTSKIDPMPIWVKPGTPKDSSDYMQGYCYQFWRCRNNAYRADGLAGQYIIVMPDQDAVLAITAEIYDTQNELNLVWKYLLPSLHKDNLPADEKTAALLKQKLSSLAVPVPAKSVLPANAKAMAGKVFEMEPNEKQIKNLSFDLINNTCQVTIKTDTSIYHLTFGSATWVKGETMKPGPYLVANLIGLLPFKVTGSYSWKNENTLELVLRYIETPHTETMVCHFDGTKVGVEILSSKSGSKKFEMKGEIKK